MPTLGTTNTDLPFFENSGSLHIQTVDESTWKLIGLQNFDLCKMLNFSIVTDEDFPCASYLQIFLYFSTVYVH